MTVLALRDVSFGYPPDGLRRPVLDQINLEVPQGDFLGVIGPNGGGKTTLLRLILGRIRPQRGSVMLFDDVPQRQAHRIGYVPQASTIDLSIPVTALDVVLAGRLRSSPWGWRFGAEHRTAALSALARVRGEDLAHRPLRALSGGQRQRVLIARALAAGAELLLLDEPTSGLDDLVQRELTELLVALNSRLPIVMVTHDLAFVSAHVKRVACLNHRLSVHRVEEITEHAVVEMYHGPVRLMHQHHDCPIEGHAHPAAAPRTEH